MAGFHLVAGATTFVAFLTTGAYMRMHEPPVRELGAGTHVLFTSRHIYILASALIHLVLGAYLRAGETRGVRIVQRIGSGLLTLGAVLLILAFVNEPVTGRGATAWSHLGLYCLFAGSAVHTGTGLRGGRQ